MRRFEGRDGLIEHLQGRVELGEEAFHAGRQADCLIAASGRSPDHAAC